MNNVIKKLNIARVNSFIENTRNELIVAVKTTSKKS